MAPADTFAGCSVANYMTVRVGDLAICPCHRTAYNKLLYGWFKVEDNQIVDIIGNNPQMATRVLMSNNTYCTLGCDVCKYRTVCLKGCFGAQYEVLGDPFYPIQNICDFFTAKYSFLTQKYIDMGVMEYLNSYTPYYLFYPRV
jgi:radical SAM protein with 4Fe4S-binding SPASM domain